MLRYYTPSIRAPKSESSSRTVRSFVVSRNEEKVVESSSIRMKRTNLVVRRLEYTTSVIPLFRDMSQVRGRRPALITKENSVLTKMVPSWTVNAFGACHTRGDFIRNHGGLAQLPLTFCNINDVELERS